jgi:hypothetical protein
MSLGAGGGMKYERTSREGHMSNIKKKDNLMLTLGWFIKRTEAAIITLCRGIHSLFLQAAREK